MRFRNRSGELFFLLLACLAQVVTVLACTLWREVVFVPERWKGPPLTQEYLVWYLDEYVPPIDYEGQLFSLYFPFAPLLGLLLVVGLVWLFFRFYRKGPGQKKVFFPLVAAGFLGILGFSLWLRQYGQPYYLWMDVVPLCVLSWQVLLLWGIPWVSARRRQRSLPPLQTENFRTDGSLLRPKHPPPHRAGFSADGKGGVFRREIRDLGGRCPPPRRERTPEGCPAPGGIASPGWGSGCRPPSPPHRAGCRPGGRR